MEKTDKTGYEKAQEIVRKIPVNQANFEHIAKSGKINGSLMADLCELIIQLEKDHNAEIRTLNARIIGLKEDKQ